MNLDLILNELDQSKPLAEKRLFELLRFKSISTNSKYKSDCCSRRNLGFGPLDISIETLS